MNPVDPAPIFSPTPPEATTRRRINPWNLFVGSFVPNWLLRRPEVSHGAKLTYARLAQYAGRDGQCYPRQATLASELGLGARAIRDYLRELEKFGLIETEQRGLNRSNHYFFLAHQWMADASQREVPTSDQDLRDCSAPARPDSSDQDRQNCSAPDRKDWSGPTVQENQQKENPDEEKNTHKARAPGIPSNEAEAVVQATAHGVPPDFAQKVFLHMESVGWRDGVGRRVRVWLPYVRQRWANENSQQACRQKRGALRNAKFTPPRQFNPDDYRQPTTNL